MKDPVYHLIYNLIFDAFTRDGCDELFGAKLETDNEVFAKSFAGCDFPEIWFEVPLLGEPWYDLHVLTSKRSLEQSEEFKEEIFYPGLFEWFAKRDGARQLAISHDLSKGEYDNPAAQLLVGTRDPSVGSDFLCEAGKGDVADAYKTFLGKIPPSWFACYLGTFPGRDDMCLRVECIPGASDQKAYSSYEDALRADLKMAGFVPDDGILAFICSMAKQPFQIEFQFNVKSDGSVSPFLGVSLRFAVPNDKYPHLSFSGENEDVVSLMGDLKKRGLCDDRWQKLAGCAFAKRLSVGDVSFRFGGYPAFIKVRMTTDSLIDAKAYMVSLPLVP